MYLEEAVPVHGALLHDFTGALVFVAVFFVHGVNRDVRVREGRHVPLRASPAVTHDLPVV